MFKFAKRVGVPGIQLLYRPNNLNRNRMAVLLRRGFRSAVHRNREKRIVKECYRNIKNYLQVGLDLIFLIFPGSLSFSKRYTQVYDLLVSAGLLLNNEKS